MGKATQQPRRQQNTQSVAAAAAAAPLASDAPAEGGSVEQGLALATTAVPVAPCGGCGTPKPINEVCPTCSEAGPRTGDFPRPAAIEAARELEADHEDGHGVIVECPLKHTAAYASSNINYLPRWAAQELRDLADGLADQGTKLESGKAVSDTRDAIIWFAEQLRRGRQRAEA